jgi:NAD(P)-dependent dehydrogenase (short-subunit alcohol dehydrogenase family)
VVVISGGLGGIGRAITRRLASRSCRVVVLYHRTSPADARQFMESLAHNDHCAIACDLTDMGSVNACVRAVARRYGRIDHVIHAAVGMLVRKKASVMLPEAFREQFEVTLFGGFNLLHAVIPHLGMGSRLIGMTTVALDPTVPQGSMAGYLCAKFALRGLLRQLSKELKPRNIFVAAVAPDFVETPLHQDLPPRAMELIRESHPAKRLTTPEDVAHVVEMLCMDPSAFGGYSVPVGRGTPSPL